MRSLIIPGAGQAHRGSYGKATLFASAAVISGVGIFISQIHYNRASERYNDLKRTYLSYEDRLAGGEVLNFNEIEGTYQDMQSALDQAETRYRWRNIFLGTFIGTYALNLIDIALNRSSQDEEKTGLSIEIDHESVRVVKCVRF